MNNSKIKKIIFTGGGSGGHVMPALSIINKLIIQGHHEIHYIGGQKSIERELVREYQLKYHAIHTGKLRRYISLENLKDLARVFLGVLDSLKILSQFNRHETLVFATGGFVTVPVAMAAFLLRFPLYIHEQTSRVGLANKICSYFAQKIFISFHDSKKYFNANKTFVSGYPLREECFSKIINPVVLNGIDLKKISKPILFVTGGGNGAKLLNNLIKRNLPILLESFFIVHQVGKDHIDEFNELSSEHYVPLPFIGKEMIDLFKLSKVIVSRAGAGTVSELMALGIRSFYIPLKIAQKNEQYFNAMEAKKNIQAIVIEEDYLTDENFLKTIHYLRDADTVLSVKKSENALDFLIKEINLANS